MAIEHDPSSQRLRETTGAQCEGERVMNAANYRTGIEDTRGAVAAGAELNALKHARKRSHRKADAATPQEQPGFRRGDQII